VKKKYGRLATSIPPPRRHTIHYGGVLAPASKIRPEVVPPPPPVPAGQTPRTRRPSPGRPRTGQSIARGASFSEGPSPRTSIEMGTLGGFQTLPRWFAASKARRLPTREMHQVWRAYETEGARAEAREHRPLPEASGRAHRAAALAAARAPPYWQARELRHRPQAQTGLFDA
jgi:hypothetical protein